MKNQQLANLPNSDLEKLFLAIYFNDLESVIDFKENYPQIYAQKHNFLLEDNLTFDLTYLTLFHKVIWFDDDWRKDIMPFIETMRTKTTKMLEFWQQELADYPQNFDKNNYHKYHEYFFCEEEFDNTEEIDDEPLDSFVQKGFREIDVRLFNRAEVFDFIEVAKLLEQGADVNVYIYNDGDYSVMRKVSRECSFLATCEVTPDFERFERDGYYLPRPFAFGISELFGGLLGFSAHEEMYQLLIKYDTDK